MSEILIQKHGLENYKLGELAYNSYADNLDHLNDGLTGGGISIPAFVDNTDENQEAWIKADKKIKEDILKNQNRFFFQQDQDGYWYKIPFEKFNDFGREKIETFSEFKLYGSIENISFVDPQYYPF